ncbi:hypothetical protein LTR62_002691 [Meristemomyces frigidus]|uniref:Isochorismatase-like domain-containing protein n=1 Tax=Meristemomyces frigidus TaxID=1508187 RepID=A0AAN7TFW3_9PEZI|nr:hypothetical protein LTR62_002691 [Meristemomyces frigidus]
MTSTQQPQPLLPTRNDPASPLHYPAAQTCLLLMDFQNFIIEMCGPVGTAAVSQAKHMLDWAHKNDILVLHSIVDLGAPPASNSKRKDRLIALVDSLKKQPQAVAEHEDLAFNQHVTNDHIVLKTPGIISGLKARGAMELLAERGIKSLLICGLSTSGCVLRTVVPATDDGFVVSVIRDACADPKEGLHEVLMGEVLGSRAWVVGGEEFRREWEG